MKKILYIFILSVVITSCSNTSARKALSLDGSGAEIDVMNIPDTFQKGDTVWVSFNAFNKFPYQYSTDSGFGHTKAVLQ